MRHPLDRPRPFSREFRKRDLKLAPKHPEFLAVIRHSDVYWTIISQLSSLMSSMVWAQLPREVVDMVLERIALSPSHLRRFGTMLSMEQKGSINTLSLVCKHSMNLWRPFLFHTLTLRSISDIYLLRILCNSDFSGWLGEHIHCVNIDHSTTSSGLHI